MTKPFAFRLRLTTVITAMILSALTAPYAAAQTPSPFLFSVTAPDTNLSIGDARTSTAVAERGLTLWSGAAFDPGTSTEAKVTSDLIVRSMRGTVDFTSGGERISRFQQLEILRRFGNGRMRDVAVGGGVRQEWDGTRTFIARIVGGLPVAGGRFESNAVFEKAAAGGRDRVDMITTVGWSRPVATLVSLGVEAIGQDLEGFWEQDEADGGARLLFGPSVHVASVQNRWSFTVAGGPVVGSTSTIPASSAAREMPTSSNHSHYAVLGSCTYSFTR